MMMTLLDLSMQLIQIPWIGAHQILGCDGQHLNNYSLTLKCYSHKVKVTSIGAFSYTT